MLAVPEEIKKISREISMEAFLLCRGLQDL